MSKQSNLTLNVGADCHAFLAEFTEVVERLEKVAGVAKTSLKAKTTAQESDDEEEAETVAPTKRATKAKPADDEEFDVAAGSDDEEESITIKEVIAACKANREVAVKVLKKMKVNSVHELKPTQYAKVMSEIGA